MTGVWWAGEPVADPRQSPEARARRLEDAAERAAYVARSAVAADLDEWRRLLPFTIGAAVQRWADESGAEVQFGPGR